MITANIEEIIYILKHHLDQCDTDELASIASLVSGAEVWPNSDDPETFEINTETDDYGGLFDHLAMA
jgi:hypothetical protein